MVADDGTSLLVALQWTDNIIGFQSSFKKEVILFKNQTKHTE